MKNRECSEGRILGEQEEKVQSAPIYIVSTTSNPQLKHAFCVHYLVEHSSQLSKVKTQNWDHHKVHIIGGEEEEPPKMDYSCLID